MKHLYSLILLFIGAVCFAQNAECVKRVPVYCCKEETLLGLIDSLVAREARYGLIDEQKQYDITISVYDISAGCYFVIMRDSTAFQFVDTLVSLNDCGYFNYKGHRIMLNLGRIPGSIMSIGCICPTDEMYCIKCPIPQSKERGLIDDTIISMPHIEIWGSIENGKVSSCVMRNENFEIIE